MEEIINSLLCISCFILVTIPCYSATITTNTLLQGQQLKDWEYLVSEEATFRLGFFSLRNSRNRYLGIFYNSRYIDERNREVWVANRNTPISDSSSILQIDEFGKLIISRTAGSPIILSSAEARTGSNVSATLYDSGNFVLREVNSDGSKSRVLWQSFDYPTDTLLPGMKLGINLSTGQTWSLTSWISDENPAPGSFKLGLDPNGSSRLIIWWRGSVFWTSGLWQNGHFELAPNLPFDQNLVFSYISNENEKYFMFSAKRNSTGSRYVIDLNGVLKENYGAILMCSIESLHNKNQNEFGCVPEILPNNCRGNGYWFQLKNVRVYEYLSEGYKFDDSQNMSIFDCQSVCWANCSCIAYASINKDGTCCKIWSKISFSKYYSVTNNDEVYFLESPKAKWWIWLIVAIVGFVVMLTTSSLYYFIHRKRRIAGEIDEELEILLYELGAPTSLTGKSGKGRERNKSEELHFFSYESIVNATNNFSVANKLGEGGFGPVFKGKLHDNQEVAIKRLSQNSGQGVIEFKNEVMLIAKLQHKNLVRIIGCCIHKQEKILIYEYMPNKSLDFFLFDSDKKHTLDWKKRLDIIEGVVQGLLYLHKYSRLRIVHRDLKASNILLDAEMNPKISDFGMARIVGPDECQANTKRVVGTYGYMSPEYAMEGIFSTKSDVYSFGVLLLEIVSGRKNNSFCHSDGPINLVGHAWELWRKGRSLELIDSMSILGDESCEIVERCIHVGLLCVEENPMDRPSMLEVMSMIYNESYNLPQLKQPAFHKGTNFLQADQLAECIPEHCSLNKMSISDMDAR
ncbi:G-type lectin S-receptor-like serine/threonine-protein kinase CES101 [Euphorbia lathyris]|uniref:G-type lectin S-receptor-like serine/threonine-protein kinase CES101 n=1 Tax=Euphorbia lathyris TaxID=212925 RepID=UPI003313890F